MKTLFCIFAALSLFAATCQSSQDWHSDPEAKLERLKSPRILDSYLKKVCNDPNFHAPHETYGILFRLRYQNEYSQFILPFHQKIIYGCLKAYNTYLSNTPYSQFAHVMLLNVSSHPKYCESSYTGSKVIQREPKYLQKPIAPAPRPWGIEILNHHSSK